MLQNKFSRHKVYDNFPYYENGKNYILPVLSTLMFISIVKFYVLPEQLFKNVFLLAHFEVGIYAFYFLFWVPVVEKYVIPTSINLNFAKLF